jgi:hypothetical protein
MIQTRNGPPGSPPQAGRPKVESLAKEPDALSVAICGDIKATLALSDERDQWLRRECEAERRGYARGYRRGRADESDDWMAQLAPARAAARRIADPAADVAMRLAAALDGERRDAREHWRKRWAELFARSRDPRFVREAYATKPWKRDYEQLMAIMLSEKAARQGGEAS